METIQDADSPHHCDAEARGTRHGDASGYQYNRNEPVAELRPLSGRRAARRQTSRRSAAGWLGGGRGVRRSGRAGLRRFFDANALKKYVRETDSARVRRLLGSVADRCTASPARRKPEPPRQASGCPFEFAGAVNRLDSSSTIYYRVDNVPAFDNREEGP
jgi:hypothetical protein